MRRLFPEVHRFHILKLFSERQNVTFMDRDWTLRKSEHQRGYLIWARIHLSKALAKSQSRPASSIQCLKLWIGWNLWNLKKKRCSCNLQTTCACKTTTTDCLSSSAGATRSRRYGVSSKICGKGSVFYISLVMRWNGLDLWPVAFEIVLVGSPEVQVHIRAKCCDYTAIEPIKINI